MLEAPLTQNVNLLIELNSPLIKSLLTFKVLLNLDSAVENITATDRRWSVATGAVSE